jgi:hypothetical protein
MKRWKVEEVEGGRKNKMKRWKNEAVEGESENSEDNP